MSNRTVLILALIWVMFLWLAIAYRNASIWESLPFGGGYVEPGIIERSVP